MEFRCDAEQSHGVEISSGKQFRTHTRQRLSDAGLEIPCLATSLQLAVKDSLDQAPARIELAASIGAKAIRVFCGQAGENYPLEEVIQIVGERLRLLAQQSASLGVEVWLETHDTLHRAETTVAAVKIANHPAVGVNYDNMHPYRMHEPLEETFAALDGLIRHTHMHDAKADDDLHSATILALDEGDMPMDDMMRRLAATSYDDYLGGEWFADEYGPDPETSLASFRRQMTTLALRNGIPIDE